jgi:hypothetical protein
LQHIHWSERSIDILSEVVYRHIPNMHVLVPIVECIIPQAVILCPAYPRQRKCSSVLPLAEGGVSTFSAIPQMSQRKTQRLKLPIIIITEVNAGTIRISKSKVCPVYFFLDIATLL